MKWGSSIYFKCSHYWPTYSSYITSERSNNWYGEIIQIMILWRTFQNHSIKFLLKQSENIDHIRVVFHCPGIKHKNTMIKDIFFKFLRMSLFNLLKKETHSYPEKINFSCQANFLFLFIEGIRKGDAVLWTF